MKNDPQLHTTPLAVDIVIFTIEESTLKVLLIKRTYDPYTDSWALPGGFMREDETTQQAAVRVLKDKTGVSDVYLEQLYTFDTSGRDPRGNIPTVAYFALIPREKIKFGEGSNLQNPIFFSVRSLPRLAFDHASVIKYAHKRLVSKLEYTNAVYALLPKNFRLSELQKIYEIVWNKSLNKRNFQKKFLSLKLIRPTGKILSGGHHRPARLYAFISRKPAELKKFF